MPRIFVIVLASSLSIFLSGCSKSVEVIADMVLIDGNVITMDENLGQLEAIALRGHKVLAVGST